MITPEQLKDLLSAAFPTCYYDFSDIASPDRPKSPPYCAIIEEKPGTVLADDKVYYSEPTYSVELYTSRTDYASESVLEGIFDSNGIAFDKAGKLLLREEKKFMTVYKI